MRSGTRLALLVHSRISVCGMGRPTPVSSSEPGPSSHGTARPSRSSEARSTRSTPWAPASPGTSPPPWPRPARRPGRRPRPGSRTARSLSAKRRSSSGEMGSAPIIATSQRAQVQPRLARPARQPDADGVGRGRRRADGGPELAHRLQPAERPLPEVQRREHVRREVVEEGEQQPAEQPHVVVQRQPGDGHRAAGEGSARLMLSMCSSTLSCESTTPRGCARAAAGELHQAGPAPRPARAGTGDARPSSTQRVGDEERRPLAAALARKARQHRREHQRLARPASSPCSAAAPGSRPGRPAGTARRGCSAPRPAPTRRTAC